MEKERRKGVRGLERLKGGNVGKGWVRGRVEGVRGV